MQVHIQIVPQFTRRNAVNWYPSRNGSTILRLRVATMPAPRQS